MVPSTPSSPSTPLLPIMSSSPSSSSGGSGSEDSSDGTPTLRRFFTRPTTFQPNSSVCCGLSSHRCVAVLPGHVGPVSCLALCGEFILSASLAKDIILWQQPDLRQLARFGHGEGSVKAVVAVGNRVFTAHQDSRIRVWKLSRRSENVFRLTAALPTTKDYLGKFIKQSNYVETRRHHRRLWIEHADSISCLAVHDGMVYSGSWDKTLKVWRISDLKCLESIKAHTDSINGLAVDHRGVVYSASADGKIKLWERNDAKGWPHRLKGEVDGHEEMSWNSVVVNGGYAYGGGSDGRVMGWRTGDLSLVCDVRAHEMSVLCLCSAGEFVCCGSADRSISVWKMGGGVCGGGLQRVAAIRGHEGPVKCLQGSDCSLGGTGGFLLYSGGLDKSLRVWWVPKDYHGHGWW